MSKKYRLVTRNDIDGLMCGALLNELNLIDDILFVKPNEMQKGEIEINQNDIVANLPYNKNAYLVFDHHGSEIIRIPEKKQNHILDIEAKSVSRVIFNYYGASKTFKKITWEMIKYIDNLKGNNIPYQEIISPSNWAKISIILDERTDLEKYVGTELVNDIMQFSIDFIEYIGEKGIDYLINHQDIQNRLNLLEKYKEKFEKQILDCTTVINDKIIILDKTKEKIIYPGNRFFVFTTIASEPLYLINIFEKDDKVTFAVRHNPMSYKQIKNIGFIMYKFGGGGNNISGTCIVKQEEKEITLEKLIQELL